MFPWSLPLLSGDTQISIKANADYHQVGTEAWVINLFALVPHNRKVELGLKPVASQLAYTKTGDCPTLSFLSEYRTYFKLEGAGT